VNKGFLQSWSYFKNSKSLNIFSKEEFYMSRQRKGILLASLSVLMAGLLVVPSSITPAQATEAVQNDPDPNLLQNAFEQASQEFGVPQSILMSVGYNETRWEQHRDEPSMAGGYGVMHLTQVGTPDLSAKGEAEEETASGAVATDPSLHTLDAAAALIGVEADTLKQDAVQNIRGGAALLAEYARDTTGSVSQDPAAWYGAVAKYSGTDEEVVAKDFADAVYTTVQQGVEQTTSTGQHAVLAAAAVTPDTSTASKLHLRNSKKTGADCPNGLACRYIPALYKQLSSSATNYGNYDLATREEDGLDIRYIIIHDIEGSYQAGISTFLAPSYVSAHYVVNNTDGEITEMVRPNDVAWQAGNWYLNSHSIGIEHAGVAVEGATWYTEQMYRSSAKLVRYLADKYHIPLDRQHILGHDDLPGLSQTAQRNMHWDPGAYWDWSHYFELLGEKIKPSHDKKDSGIVTINPDFETNQPNMLYGTRQLVPQASNFVYLYSEPSLDAPLISDNALHPDGKPGTTQINDWGDKAVIGHTFAVAERQDDWTAIWYGAKKAWFYNPNNQNTVPGSGLLVTPKAGLASIPVYGAAYPEAAAFDQAGLPRVTNNALQYRIPAGQVYVSAGTVPSTYFYAKLYNAPSTYRVVKGTDEYYQISFNHRIAFIKKSDVDVK
jgi:N-acetyl-anhydromuramyl-L-alanine amidase AmpD